MQHIFMETNVLFSERNMYICYTSQTIGEVMEDYQCSLLLSVLQYVHGCHCEKLNIFSSLIIESVKLFSYFCSYHLN
jgi:hypothetical protein